MSTDTKQKIPFNELRAGDLLVSKKAEATQAEVTLTGLTHDGRPAVTLKITDWIVGAPRLGWLTDLEWERSAWELLR